MARVKRGTTTKARHKRLLKEAKGYWGRRKNTIRVARQAYVIGGAERIDKSKCGMDVEVREQQHCYAISGLGGQMQIKKINYLSNNIMLR